MRLINYLVAHSCAMREDCTLSPEAFIKAIIISGMKRYITLLFFLLCFVLAVKAQDFHPGGQAQGYLDGKNATVDYATGTFHYSIPLHTLRAGDYELPLLLDYAGVGVKANAVYGLLGYNWSLNTGGVVTRMLRGGIADEDYNGRAYLEHMLQLTGSENYKLNATKVNLRWQDGESDIFSAYFGSSCVHFIIRIDSVGHLSAHPLECTGVKIEPTEFTSQIKGWHVTDEHGNQYYYEQPERTEYALSEGGISRNGVRNSGFISSWHLTRIRPINGDAINFHYREKEWKEECYVDGRQSEITYGDPITEHPLDFFSYEFSYREYLSNARRAMGNVNQDILAQLNSLGEKEGYFTGAISETTSTMLKLGQKDFHTNSRFIGIIDNLTSAISSGVQLINRLESIASYYSSLNYNNARYVDSYLRGAAQCVKSCLSEERMVRTKLTHEGSSNFVQTVILERIIAPDREVALNYDNRNRLHTLILVDSLSGVTLDTVTLTYGLYGPERVVTTASDGLETSSLAMDYYVSPVTLNTDAWGYYTTSISDAFGRLPQDDAVKNYSLKSVITREGTAIHLDYESNTLNRGGSSPSIFGGIRLKSLVMTDVGNGIADSIRYEYPMGACLIYDDYYDSEEIHYNGCRPDKVRYSRVKYKGNAYVNTGNNGLYYPYVKECRAGQGCKAHLFFVPSAGGLTSYQYWLCGLPLGTACYDERGNLLQLNLNRYSYSREMAHPFGNVPVGNEWALTGDSLTAPYDQAIPQIAPYEYYTDKEEMASYYRTLPGSEYFDPYRDVYLRNIAPRSNVVFPRLDYSLAYGGNILLREQREYRFEADEHAGQGTELDFAYSRWDKRTPYSRTEYHYDPHAKLPSTPLRIISFLSNGDSCAVEEKRLGHCIDTVDVKQCAMLARNMLMPMCHRTVYNNNKVVDEEITEYDFYLRHSDTLAIVPIERHILSL